MDAVITQAPFIKLPESKKPPERGHQGASDSQLSTQSDDLASSLSNLNMGDQMNEAGDFAKKAAEMAARLHEPTPSDFECLSVIGTGSYSKVFLVREKKTLQLLAMKVLSKGDGDSRK